MKTVAVSGGTFNDGGSDLYKPYKAGGEYPSYGAQMSKLTFTPKNTVTNSNGDKAKEVSLVQTTTSSIVEHDPRGEKVDAPDQPESMLDARRTEAGTAIDQQILLVGKGKAGKWPAQQFVQLLDPVKTLGTKRVRFAGSDDTPVNEVIAALLAKFESGNSWADDKRATSGQISGFRSNLKNILDAEGEQCDGTLKAALLTSARLLDDMTTLVNLDPRYAEERHRQTDPMKPGQPRNTAIGASEASPGSTGWNAHRDDAARPWTGNAVLRDRPAHSILAGHTLHGTETFEVAAMADGNKFVGSIEWGWTIDGREPALLNGGEIKKTSDGASEEFYEAAGKWNEMAVPDPMGGDAHETFRLPVE